MSMYKRIAAGTDLSATAKIATDRAAYLARALGAELTLVHAGRDPGDPLDDLVRQYDAEKIVEEGSPAEVLVAATERAEADLLVVGSVGMSGARRFLLGSVPNKVSHHAGTDLLIVKTDPPPKETARYRKVLVGTDGSPTATRAVKTACALAMELGASAMIVCAYESPTEQELAQLRGDPNDPVEQWSARGAARSTPEEFRWRIAGAVQAEDVLDRAASAAQEQGANAEVRAIAGHPADVLLGVAEDEAFDLIAVGSVGMTGTKRFMLGNVPHRISHHAPTDVMIFRTQ